MKKKAIALALVLIIFALQLCGCQSETKEQKATYYMVSGSWSYIDQYIYEYNKHCSNEDMKIEIVEFESEEELANKFFAEVMAGNGPDIMGVSLISKTNISIDKLISQDIFMDLNELLANDTQSDKLNLDDYNQHALNSGVINGKRYFIPVVYSPDVVTAYNTDLTQYIDRDFKNFESLTYSELAVMSEKYKGYLLSIEDFAKDLFYDCINQQVDIESKTANFNSKEFIETIDCLKSIVNSYNYTDNRYLKRNEYLFSTDGNVSIYNLASELCCISDDGEKPIILNLPTLHNGSSAQINDAIFVNANCKNNEAVMQFIKYALSEKVQGEITGVNINEYNPNVSGGFGEYYPVHNGVMDTLFEKCTTLSFDKAFAENYEDSLDIKTQDKKLTSTDINNIKQYIKSIDNFKLCNEYSQYDTVIKNVTEDYWNDKINLPQFIDKLASITNIYLNE